MNTALKRSFALLLALALCLSLLPLSALADEADEVPFESPLSTEAELEEEATLTVTEGDLDDPSFTDEGEDVELEDGRSPVIEATDEALALEEPVELDPADLGGDDGTIPFDEEINEDEIVFDQEIEIDEDIGGTEALGGIAGAKVTVGKSKIVMSMISHPGISVRFENVPKGGKVKIGVWKNALQTSNIVKPSLSAIKNGSATLTLNPQATGTAHVLIYLCNSLGIPYDIARIDVTVCRAQIHWAGYVDEVTVPVGGTQTLYFYGEGYSGTSAITATSSNTSAYTTTVQAVNIAGRVPVRIEGKKVGSGQIQVWYRAKSTNDGLDVKTVKVNVVAAATPKVKLSTAYVNVAPGKSVDVDLSASGYSGSYLYLLTSTNTAAYSCAWVDKDTVRVTGNAEGSGTVTAHMVTWLLKELATAKFTVNVAPEPKISTSSSALTVTAGCSASATYKITDLPTNSSLGVSNSRSDLVSATMTNEGGGNYKVTVVGKNPGTTTLTVYVKNRSGITVATRQLSVTVKQAPPSAKVSTTSLTVGYNETKTITLAYYNCPDPVTFHVTRSNSGVTWSFDKWNGNTLPMRVKGLSAGTTTITAQLIRQSDKAVLDTKTITVTVKAASPNDRFTIGQVGYGFYNYRTTISEKICQYAYGKTQVATNVYEYAKKKGLANGVCYGMATSGGLLASKTVLPSSFRASATQASQLDKNDYSSKYGLKVHEFIEAMHIAQVSTTRYDNGISIDSVARGIMSELDAGRPVFVGIRGEAPDGKGGKCESGHRTTAFGYSLSGNVLKVSIYDPNSPLAAKTMTFTRPSASSAFNTWEFYMGGSIGTWGSGRRYADIYYSTLANIKSIWNNMGSLYSYAKLMDMEENLIITDEKSFTLYTMDFDTMEQVVVAKVVDGELVEAAEGVYNAWINEADSEGRVYMLWVPGDYYFVNDDTPGDGLSISIVGATVSTTIETDKSLSGDDALGALGFCAEDASSTAEAAVTMADGAVYTISIGSTNSEGISKTISKEGIGTGNPVSLGLKGDTVSLGSTVGEGDDPYDGAGITIEPAIERYELLAVAGEGGSVTPEGATVLNAGENALVRIAADEGYSIGDVVVDGQSVGPVSQWYFEDVTDHHTLEATFKRDLSDVEVTLEQNKFAYDGEEKTPAVTVVDPEGNELTELVDYIVSYDNNVQPGKAEVTLMALPGSDYTGVKKVTFRIEDEGLVEDAEADEEKITVHLSEDAVSVPGKLFAAAYDADGRLIYIGQAETAETVTFKLSKALPEDAVVRLYLVDDSTTPRMTPYELD